MPPITPAQNKPGLATAPSAKDGIMTARSVRTKDTSVFKRAAVKKTFASPDESVGGVAESAVSPAPAVLATSAGSPAAVPNNDPITPSRPSKSYNALTASARNRMRAMEDAKKPAAGSDSPPRPSKRSPMPALWYLRTSPSNRSPKFHVSMKNGRILKVDRAGVPASRVMTSNGAGTRSAGTTANDTQTGSAGKAAHTRVEVEASSTTVDKDPTVTNEATPASKAHQTVPVPEAPPTSITEPAAEIPAPIRNGKTTSHRPRTNNSNQNSDSRPSQNLGVATHGTTASGEATSGITGADKTASTDTGQAGSVTTGESVPGPGSATTLLSMDARSVPNADIDSDGGSYPTAHRANWLNPSASGGALPDGDTTKGLTADAVASWAASVAINAQLPDISNTEGHDQRASHEHTYDSSTDSLSGDADCAVSSLNPLTVSKDLTAHNANTPAGSSSSARTPAHPNNNTPDTPIVSDEVNETIRAMRNMRARVSVKKLNDVSSSWALSRKNLRMSF